MLSSTRVDDVTSSLDAAGLLAVLDASEPITDALRPELLAQGIPDAAITEAAQAGFVYCRSRRSFFQFDLSGMPADLLPARFRAGS